MQHFFGLDLQDGSLTIGGILLLVAVSGGLWLFVNIPELPADKLFIFETLELIQAITGGIIIYGALRLNKTAINVAGWLLTAFVVLDLIGICYAVYLIIFYVNKDEVLHEGQFIPYVVTRFISACINIYFIFVLSSFYKLLNADEGADSKKSVRADNSTSYANQAGNLATYDTNPTYLTENSARYGYRVENSASYDTNPTLATSSSYSSIRY